MEYDNYGFELDDKDARLGEALEHLQVMLSIEMRRLRKREGISQKELGERMGVNQPTVSKLENAHVQSDFESLLKYLIALDADLVLGFLDDDNFIPVSEAAEDWYDSLKSGANNSTGLGTQNISSSVANSRSDIKSNTATIVPFQPSNIFTGESPELNKWGGCASKKSTGRTVFKIEDNDLEVG